VVSDVIYYAGDDYTQNTDKPPICRYDGRVSTVVLEAPYITGTTPAKAILSLAADSDGNIYFSTWDSGTGASDFAGRVFKFAPATGITETFGTDVYTAGRLPYSLTVFNDKLYVGTINQAPANGSLIRSLALADAALDYVPDASTTTTYQVTASNATGEGVPTAAVSVTQRATLTTEAFNAVSWTAPGGATSYKLYRTAGHSSTGVIASQAGTSFTDDGDAGDASSPPAIPSTDASPLVTASTFLDQNIPYQYAATLTRGGIESAVTYMAAPTDGPTSQSAGSNNMNIFVTLNFNDALTTVKIYRIQGSGTNGLIKTVTQAPNLPGNVLNVFDNTANGDGNLPKPGVPTNLIITKTNPKLLTGGVGCLVPYNAKLYAGMFYTSSGFATVQEVTSANAISTSTTAAPGGSASDYNGFTAGIEFNGNLYMAYWVDAATDVTLIMKYTGSSWSTVKTISGAGARPIVGFAEVDGKLWAYGGGDAKTGILYQSNTAGDTWTDQSALLPTSKEAIPFIANTNVLGGF
jgi:hypothetical protein